MSPIGTSRAARPACPQGAQESSPSARTERRVGSKMRTSARASGSPPYSASTPRASSSAKRRRCRWCTGPSRQHPLGLGQRLWRADMEPLAVVHQSIECAGRLRAMPQGHQGELAVGEERKRRESQIETLANMKGALGSRRDGGPCPCLRGNSRRGPWPRNRWRGHADAATGARPCAAGSHSVFHALQHGNGAVGPQTSPFSTKNGSSPSSGKTFFTLPPVSSRSFSRTMWARLGPTCWAICSPRLMDVDHDIAHAVFPAGGP